MMRCVLIEVFMFVKACSCLTPEVSDRRPTGTSAEAKTAVLSATLATAKRGGGSLH